MVNCWNRTEYCWCELHFVALVTTIALFCEVWARRNGWASTDQRIEQGV